MEYTIHLTNKCNMSCKYCYQGLKKNDNTMSIETLKNTLDFIFTTSSEKVAISFIGGEPLLEKEKIYFALKYIETNYSNRKVKYSITTNCTLLDEKIIGIFEKYKFEIRASIDGDQKTQDINRLSNFKYEKIIRNIYKLKKLNLNLSIRMTVASNNCEFLYQNIRYFNEAGFNNICVGINYFEQDKDYLLKTLKKELPKIEEYYLEQNNNNVPLLLDIIDGKFLPIFVNEKLGFSKCSAGKNHLTIGTDGKIYPCSYVVDKEEYAIGNIINGLFKNKLIRFELNNIKKDNFKCEQCSISKFCHGMKCAYLNFRCTGYLNLPNNIMCELEKILFEMNVRIIEKLIDAKNSRITDIFKFLDENSIDNEILYRNLLTKI